MLTLREYQKEGVEFLKSTPRCFLKDDVGLGKSIQAAEAAERPVLLVVPKNVIGQWNDFLTANYVGERITCAIGTRAQREKALAKKADWYIINYDMIKSYALPTNIRTIVFDESHHLRNHTSNRARAAVLLANRNPTVRIYMLSATPMWKSVTDIFMQLRVLFPTVFKSYREFVHTWCTAIDTPYGQQVVGIKKSMRGPLKELLGPIMIGRTAKDVGLQLPPRIDNVITVELRPELRKLYKRIKDDYKLKIENEDEKRQILFSPMGMLHVFRQITVREKYEPVMELLEDNQKPSLIGFWYRDHATELYNMMKREGMNCVLLTGEVDGLTRYKLAKKAEREKAHIVCTEDSMKEGMNLYQYRQVINVEEHYVPKLNEQFIGRVVRNRNDDGVDQEPVLVYCVHVKNSVDVDIHRTATGRNVSIEKMVEMILT